MKVLMMGLALAMSSTTFAHEDEGGGPNVGKGKGVEFYDEHEGFKLSKEAVKRFGIEMKDISLPACDLKGIQIVSALDHKEIFVLRGENFKSIEVKCSEVKPGDRAVIKGAEYLRVVEMDLTSGDDDHEDHQDDGIEKADSRDSKEKDHD